MRSGVPDRTRGPGAVERTAADAYRIAGISPDEVDVVEVHDAAAPAELIAIEELGLAEPGASVAMNRSGETSIGGRIPVNTGGGLLSRGHPVGATGGAQLTELVWQLRGGAGARQVEGARIGLAENAGGWIDGDPAVATVTIIGR
jgi:acetyl-CoA acetyltransferase